MSFKNGTESFIKVGGNADEFLSVVERMGRSVSGLFSEILKTSGEITRGTHAQEDATRRLIQQLQRQIGEMNTIKSSFDQLANSGRTELLTGLTDQKVGRQVLAASKLRASLSDAASAAEAFGTRYTKALANASTAQGALSRSTQKEMDGLLAAQKNLQKLQGSIDRFDVKARTNGGYSPAEFAARGKLQAELNALNRAARDETLSVANYSGQIQGIQTMVAGLGQVNTLERARRTALDKEEAAFNKLAETKRKLRKADDQAALGQIKLQERMGQERDKFEAKLRKDSRRRERTAGNMLIDGDIRQLALTQGTRATQKQMVDELIRAEARLRDAKGKTSDADLQAYANAKRRLDAATRLVRLQDQEASKAANQLRRERALDTRVGLATARADVTSLIGSVGEGTATRALEMDHERAIKNLKRASDEESKKNALEEVRLTEKRLGIIKQIAGEQGKSAQTSRQNLLKMVNMEDAQLRAQAERTGKFSYTTAEAKNFNIRQINREYDAAMAKLVRIRDLADRAFSTPGGPTLSTLARLQRAYDDVSLSIGRATAQKKAFDKTPEQQAQRARNNVMNNLFGDGGLGFGTRVAGIAAISGVAYGAIGAVTATGQYIVQLEDELNRLQAVSGATDMEMAKLARSIKEVGNNSRYTTLEIAQGATTIAQAGFSAAETADVLRNSLDLAAASGSTPAEAIDLMTSALGAFNLQASESARVADVITAGLNKTKLGIEQMRLSIQYVGATAKENSMGLNELVAMTGLLANAGVRGSTAGTGLRQLLVDLKTPSEKLKEELKAVGLSLADIDVKSKGLDQVIKNLDEAGFSADAAYEGLEVRAAASFLALRGQIDGYNALSSALIQNGAAADAAREASKGLSAQWTELKNSAGSVLTALTSGPVSVLTLLTDLTGQMVEGIDTLINKLQDLGDEGSSTGTVLQDGLTTALWGAGIGFTRGGLAGAAAGGVVGALSGMFAGLMRAGDGLDHLRAKSNEAEQAMVSQQQTVASVDEAINQLIDRSDMLQESTVAVQAETLTLSQRFENLNVTLGQSITNYDELLGAMQRLRQFEAEKLAAESREQVRSLGNERDAQLQQINQVRERIPSAFLQGQTLENSMFKSFAPRIRGVLGGDVNDPQLLIRAMNLLTEMRKKRDEETKAGRAFKTSDKELLRHLENLESLLSDYQATLASLDQANIRIDTYEAMEAVGVFNSNNTQDSIRQDAQNGYNREEDVAGSGTALINRARETANRHLAALRKQRERYKEDSLEYNTLTGEIAETEALVRSMDREETKMAEGNGQPGSNMQTVTFRQPGAGFRQTSPRGMRRHPIHGDMRMHHGTDYAAAAGTPIPAVADGVVTFVGNKSGYGNTVIVSHGNGLETLYGHMKDGTFKVQEGQSVSAGQALGGVGSSGGSTGNHLHLEIRRDGQSVDPGNWRFRIDPSAASSEGDKAREEAARELNRLAQSRAQRRVAAANARSGAIIGEARAGTRPVSDLGNELNETLAEIREARLSQYDISNPLEGLSEAAKKEIEEGRAALVQELDADQRKTLSDYYRAVGDRVMKVLGNAFDEIQDDLDGGLYEAEQIIADVNSRRRMLENDQNRYNVGAGTLYRNDQERKAAEAEASRAREVEYNAAIIRQREALAAAERELNRIAEENPNRNLEEIEDYVNKQKEIDGYRRKITDTERELNAVLRERKEIEGTAEVGPLKDRLSDAARAWMETSGAMDSVGKTLENNTGPFLDNVANGFQEFFSSIIDGSKGFKQALGDMLRSFVGFVQQMLLRALALYLVKQLLDAIMGGTGTVANVAANPAASRSIGLGASVASGNAYDGGPVVVPGRFNGGISHLSRSNGHVTRGLRSRDSAVYELAKDEYVVNNRSVKDLGLPFMDAINRHGRAGAMKMMGAGQNFMNIQRPKQETNVYVVAEPQEAGMGPSDVLVTIHRDILQGGATKKLIKAVAQGG